MLERFAMFDVRQIPVARYALPVIASILAVVLDVDKRINS